MSTIQMVVFDMAGTTVNENNVVYKTLHTAIEQAGCSVSLENVLLWGAGKEKLQAIKDILVSADSQSGKKADDIFQDFLQLLKTAYEKLDVQTYDKTEQLFDYLKDKKIKVVLNTGYNYQTASSLLQKLNWEKGKQYDLLVTADDVKKGRPHPDMIQLAMQEMGISEAKNVAKVGDSIVDIEEGKSAGCGLTFGVTTGAQTRQQLQTARPSYVINSLAELKEFI